MTIHLGSFAALLKRTLFLKFDIKSMGYFNPKLFYLLNNTCFEKATSIKGFWQFFLTYGKSVFSCDKY